MSSSPSTQDKGPARWLVPVLLGALLLLAIGLGLVTLRLSNDLAAIETEMTELRNAVTDASNEASRALDRAERAEASARAAAEGRLLAEAETARAEEQSEAARQDALSSRAAAEAARAEAEQVRREAEAELARLENALSQVAETRRTALGLVMNLGEDSLKFDFDKATLRPENKELLSRIAGILLTSEDYTVEVNGHTDDVGTEAYNLELSERRARAVRDYLVEAGIDERILTMQGFGKSQPLVQAKTEQARAKNRRVELGIVNTRIRYPQARR